MIFNRLPFLMASSCTRGDLGWTLGTIYSLKEVVRHWNGVPWEVMGSIPGSAQETIRCGTMGHGLVGEYWW